jgi:hypothetical protein
VPPPGAKVTGRVRADEPELRRLWLELSRAREAFEVARRAKFSCGPESMGARADLATALTAYADRLQAERIPVPHRIREELRLLRIDDSRLLI